MPYLWLKLVEMVHNIWETGSVLTKMGCNILVLISKLKADTGGIRLPEVVWNLVEAIINTRIKVGVDFQDVLHGFRTGRGFGTAILEIKLAQEL